MSIIVSNEEFLRLAVDDPVLQMLPAFEKHGYDLFHPRYSKFVHPVTGDSIAHIFTDSYNYSRRSPANRYRTLNFAGDSIISANMHKSPNDFFKFRV